MGAESSAPAPPPKAQASAAAESLSGSRRLLVPQGLPGSEATHQVRSGRVVLPNRRKHNGSQARMRSPPNRRTNDTSMVTALNLGRQSGPSRSKRHSNTFRSTRGRRIRAGPRRHAEPLGGCADDERTPSHRLRAAPKRFHPCDLLSRPPQASCATLLMGDDASSGLRWAVQGLALHDPARSEVEVESSTRDAQGAVDVEAYGRSATLGRPGRGHEPVRIRAEPPLRNGAALEPKRLIAARVRRGAGAALPVQYQDRATGAPHGRETAPGHPEATRSKPRLELLDARTTFPAPLVGVAQVPPVEEIPASSRQTALRSAAERAGTAPTGPLGDPADCGDRRFREHSSSPSHPGRGYS